MSPTPRSDAASTLSALQQAVQRAEELSSEVEGGRRRAQEMGEEVERGRVLALQLQAEAETNREKIRVADEVRGWKLR